MPIALAALIVELGEARRLAAELAGMTPAQADRSWCEQLEDEYEDVEVRRATMARQLARWRLDHPHASGLDELADHIAEVEPVRRALMRELARLRCARGMSGTRVVRRAALIRDDPRWTFPDRVAGPCALHVWREDETHLVAVVAGLEADDVLRTGEARDAVVARLQADHPDCEIELFVCMLGASPGCGDRFECATQPDAEPILAHDLIDRLGVAHHYRCDCRS
ncbi:hypothetical protein [Lentzea sp. NPDC055074]